MSQEKKLKRREFIANLLFAGGTLTASSFVASYGEGWEMPESYKQAVKTRPTKNPKPKPRPNPRPTKTPPQVMGDVAPPRPLPGRVVVPRSKGEAVPPSEQ